MNAQYFASLTAIILSTGLSFSETHATQSVVPSILNDTVNSNQIISSYSPPRRGTPTGRTGGGTRFAPSALNQLALA